MTYGRNTDPFAPQGRALDQPQPEKKPFEPVPPGSYGSAAIILLTDGQRTTGVDTAEAAKMAADRGVRVYTVGVGTVEGEVIGFEGWSMRVRLDEETLKAVARDHPGRVLLRRHGREPQAGLRVAEHAADGGEEGDRGLGPAGAGGGRAGAALGGLSLLWFQRVL
jgi:Ca-activated chloride channel homolog